MANNYCQFAAAFRFPEAAAEDFKKIIASLPAGEEGNEDDIDLPDWYLRKYDLLEDGEFSLDRFNAHIEHNDLIGVELSELHYDRTDGTLYFGDDMYTSPYAVALVLSDVMEAHGCREPVTFGVAYYCDKLRPGEFAGEAYAVGPDIVEVMGTGAMEEKLRKKVERQLARQEQASGQTPEP